MIHTKKFLFGILTALGISPQISQNLEAAPLFWQWKNGPSLHKGRQNAGAVSLDNTLFIVGGQGKEGLLSSGEKYSPSTGTWTFIPEMPKARCCFASVIFRNELYVLGGLETTPAKPSTETMIFNPVTEQWRLGPSLRIPRKNASATVVHDTIILVGGADSQGNPIASMDIFDGQRWSELSKLPTPRESVSSVFAGSDLWVMGGYGDNPYGSNIVERYSFTSKKWIPSSPLQQARGQAAAAVLNGKIIIVGGWGASGALNSGEFLSLSQEESWKFLPELAVPRAGATSAIFQNKIFILGGGIYKGGGEWDSLRDVLLLSDN